MKRRTSWENDLHDAKDLYQTGPRGTIRFGAKNPFKQFSGTFSFSDRFVFIYFLVLIVLTVLGAAAVIR